MWGVNKYMCMQVCDYVCKFQIYLYIYTASLYSGENLLDSGAIHIARFWGNIYVYMNMNLGGYIYTTVGECTIYIYIYIYIYINMFMRILGPNISLDFGGTCMSLDFGGIHIFIYVHTNTCDYVRICKNMYVCISEWCVASTINDVNLYVCFLYVDWEICLHIREYMYIHMCGYVCMFVHTYLCLCVCVCIYICTCMFISCEYAEAKPKMDTKLPCE